MSPADLLDLLPHPVILAAAAAVVSALVAVWAGALVAGMGLDELRVPGLPAWRWSRFARATLFLALFLPLVGSAFGVALGPALAIADLATRVAAAGACVAVALAVARAREEVVQDGDRKQRGEVEGQRQHTLAIGGAAALVCLVGAAGTLVVLGLVAAGLVAALVAGGDLGQALKRGLADLAAGIELRERLRAGDRIQIDGVEYRVPLSPGLARTRLEGPDQPVRLRNVELIERLAERIELPPGGGGPG